MKRSESIAAIAAALAKAQGAMANAKKDRENPHFRSRYADLASIVDAIKGPMAANGLAYFQTVTPSDKNEVCVETTLMHASGEWIAGEAFAVPVQKGDAQGVMSALTYCRRGSLSLAVGIAPDDDDDGNAAAGAKPTPAQQEQDARPAGRMDPETVADLMDDLDRSADVAALREQTKRVLAAAKNAGDQEAFGLLRAHSVKVAKMLEEAATA